MRGKSPVPPFVPPAPNLWVHQNLNTSRSSLPAEVPKSDSKCVGGMYRIFLFAIDAEDGTKDTGSRAFDNGWLVVLLKAFITTFLCETFISLCIKGFFLFAFSGCFLIKQFPKVLSFHKNVFTVCGIC
jgi:hypothetical protein